MGRGPKRHKRLLEIVNQVSCNQLPDPTGDLMLVLNDSDRVGRFKQYSSAPSSNKVKDLEIGIFEYGEFSPWPH